MSNRYEWSLRAARRLQKWWTNANRVLSLNHIQEVRMKTRGTALILAGLLLFAQTASAENKWIVEFRPGASIPVSELGDADLGVGLGLEATAAYMFLPHTGVYAGWGWNKLGANESFAGNDVDFEETGYVFGLQFMHPMGTLPIRYLLRAGGVVNHIETENADGDILDSTPHGLGFQVGAGLGIDVTDNLLVTPSVRYRQLSRDIEIDGVETEATLRYLSLGAGIAWGF
jgi:opacity protein-like surface antigen